MKDWTAQQYHYKIINESGEAIAFVHDYLFEVEKFIIESKMKISKIERKGKNMFDISIVSDSEWKIK